MVLPLIGLMLDLPWKTVNANQLVWTDTPPQYVGRDLWYHLQFRSALAAITSGVLIAVNANPLNTQNHRQEMRAINATRTSVSSGAAGSMVISGGTSPAGDYGSILVHIQNFRSARQKIAHTFCVNEDQATQQNVRWAAVKRHGVAITGLLTDPVLTVTFQDAVTPVNLIDGTLRRAIS